jgi:large subunit ribosomal protein L3
MMNALLGRKLGMSRLFNAKGAAIAVTLLEAGPNVVVQIKKKNKDGYDAVQLGFGKKSEKSTNKPLAGHFKRAGQKPFAHLREVRLDSVEGIEVGQQVGVDLFVVGEKVDVVSTSKGLGFQGVVRRYHFAGGPKTHGQSDRLRAPGSVGASSYPSRTFKGTRMAGRMGGDTTTIKNLLVVMVDPESQIIAVRGAVPGKKNTYVRIRKK